MSLLLFTINVVIIFIVGVLVFKLKAIAPMVMRSVHPTEDLPLPVTTDETVRPWALAARRAKLRHIHRASMRPGAPRPLQALTANGGTLNVNGQQQSVGNLNRQFIGGDNGRSSPPKGKLLCIDEKRSSVSSMVGGPDAPPPPPPPACVTPPRTPPNGRKTPPASALAKVSDAAPPPPPLPVAGSPPAVLSSIPKPHTTPPEWKVPPTGTDAPYFNPLEAPQLYDYYEPVSVPEGDTPPPLSYQQESMYNWGNSAHV